MFRPIANQKLGVKRKPWPALEVLHVPLATAHVGTDVVVVAVNRVWNHQAQLFEHGH